MLLKRVVLICLGIYVCVPISFGQSDFDESPPSIGEVAILFGEPDYAYGERTGFPGLVEGKSFYMISPRENGAIWTVREIIKTFPNYWTYEIQNIYCALSEAVKLGRMANGAFILLYRERHVIIRYDSHLRRHTVILGYRKNPQASKDGKNFVPFETIGIESITEAFDRAIQSLDIDWDSAKTDKLLFEYLQKSLANPSIVQPFSSLQLYYDNFVLVRALRQVLEDSSSKIERGKKLLAKSGTEKILRILSVLDPENVIRAQKSFDLQFFLGNLADVNLEDFMNVVELLKRKLHNIEAKYLFFPEVSLTPHGRLMGFLPLLAKKLGKPDWKRLNSIIGGEVPLSQLEDRREIDLYHEARLLDLFAALQISEPLHRMQFALQSEAAGKPMKNLETFLIEAPFMTKHEKNILGLMKQKNLKADYADALLRYRFHTLY